ncbi:acylneuraminate cytidylyltransferase family protein [Pontibacillus litoralis]|uniref:N-acylneuraminate cytidylyltransferase n=1 Tax=Pontibacillus litoralis JSM 072002 TaxID=1385512 RepID=A0A0A5HRB5_9BACI|nr:acylneuraminate cytidylyltransferase family protein [Pontibacillus litoralis]KGX86177.1 N-acylneuraminate cytidylyltransferase [Pontibacillus litoralis JSM 072002]
MLAIIPARGGSKGVPRKNIKDLAGKPLIYYAIKAAQKSNHISKVIVSTDDQEIAEIAQSFGAEVPFMRPAHLASDNAKAIDSYIYTIETINQQLNDRNNLIEEFVVLQPTSPFRSSLDIDKAIEIFYKNKADSVISVVKSEHPPQWYKRIADNGIIEDYFTSDNGLNRQEYNVTYIPNGAIYIFNYSLLKEKYSYYTNQTYPYIMSEESSLDIDTLIDFKLAEVLMKENISGATD